MSTPLRIGKFPQDRLLWDNGANFNGYAWISVIPGDNECEYTTGQTGNSFPAETLPQFSVIPIVEGRYNSSLGLFYNADISPPGSTYIARFYDTTQCCLIAGPTDPFIVDSNPIDSIPAVTLPTPTEGGTAPTAPTCDC